MEPVAEFGRYALYLPLGMGGHAAVHLGVARGRDPMPVAIKRLHDRFAHEPKAVAQLYDEVRLARQVQHPNTVRVLELVSDGADTLAVFEYVHGEPLSRLLKESRARGLSVPPAIAAAIAYDALLGLHAAHNAKGADGTPLGLVHRDVGPENVLVGADGVARITDFGIAKAEGRMNSTRGGGIRGKLVYLAPEQVGGTVDRRTDVYATGLTLWEVLTGKRPLDGPNEAYIVARALDPRIPKPSTINRNVSPALDEIVMKALEKNPDDRYRSASSFAAALQRAVPIAEPSEVSEWVVSLGGARLDDRWEQLQRILASEQRANTSMVTTGASAIVPAHQSGGHGSLARTGSAPGMALAAPALVQPSFVAPSGALGPDTFDVATHQLPAAAPPEKGSYGTIIAWCVAGLALAFAVYARIQTPPPDPPLAAPPPVRTAEPEPPRLAIPDPPRVVPPAPDDSASDLADDAPKVAPDVPKKPPVSPDSKQPQKRVQPPPHRTTPAAPATNCDPPTYLDAKGIKRYKPACL
jgi:serine/threonine-protein kinase